MPKIERKTRWTAQELKEHYSKPLSRFYSPKQKQQHNLFAKYVNEGKFTDRRVLRDNAVNLGKSVRTQQVINGLHPNAVGRVQTSKLGKVNVKASDAANTIPASNIEFNKYYWAADIPQSEGQHNIFGFRPETDEMIVRYQNKKGKVSWNHYNEVPGKPRQAQHNIMSIFDSRVPVTTMDGEQTIELNRIWQRRYRDTFSAGRKISFANKKEEKAAYKAISTGNLWDEDYVKPSNFTVKSNDAWNKRVEDAIKTSKKNNIDENTRKYHANLKEKYGE